MDPFVVALDVLAQMPAVVSASVHVSRHGPARVTVRRRGTPKFLEFEAASIGEALNAALRALGETVPATGTDG